MTIRVTTYRAEPPPAAPPPKPQPRKPQPQSEDPRRDWSDLLAAWLVVYDRTQPWRLRRRREARERIRHWTALLDPAKRRPPVNHMLIYGVALWAAIIAIAFIGGSQ